MGDYHIQLQDSIININNSSNSGKHSEMQLVYEIKSHLPFGWEWQ